jgi:hypothetical protein
MSLTACLFRKGVEDAERGWPQADSKPCRGGRFSLHNRKTGDEKILDLFFFPWLGFQTNEQRDCDHIVPLLLCAYDLFAMRYD